MSEIPEDIMKAAREAAAKVWGVGVGGEALAAEFRSGMRDDSGSVETAVAAILAERERCAKIAEAGLVCRSCGHVGEITECCDRMNFDGATNAQIAAAIRNTKP